MGTPQPRSLMQRPRLSIDIHPDLGKNPARDEASTLGPRSDNRARWLKFADCALHPHGATEEDIAELTNLARDEQETIKSRIEHGSRSEETEQIEALDLPFATSKMRRLQS